MVIVGFCHFSYRYGSMVAFFRYSPIDILSVHLPPAMLEFNGHVQQDWITKEASEVPLWNFWSGSDCFEWMLVFELISISIISLITSIFITIFWIFFFSASE